MIRSVVKRGDPLLYLPCQEIVDVEHAQGLITDLRDTLRYVQGLYEFSRGSGIAAPQIGELWRANVIEFEGQQFTLLNPEITDHSDNQIVISEGCLSFFDYRGKALRWADVTVVALDEHGEPQTIRSNGDANFSMLLQHEVGHLDGRLYDSVLAPGEELVHRPEMPTIP